MAQFYETRVIDEFVLRGNSVIMKCNLPSFVADFVYVEAWISTDDSEVEEYYPNNTKWGTVKHSNLHRRRSFVVLYAYNSLFLIPVAPP